jgi:transcriptional regulator with XRE-family HTH domain
VGKPLVLSFSASRYPSSTFGQCIKKARLEKGLKQRELAARVAVDEMTIVNWERYDAMPTRRRDKVKVACQVLGLDFGELVSRLHPETDCASFGQKLVRARVVLALTQEEVAREVGIDPGTLGRWERSIQMPPSWMRRDLERLCAKLSIDVPATA